jgi:hypothetical protein
VVVLLDMSNSMREEFERVREAGLHFAKALDPADRARIGTFGDEIALSPHLTGDKGILARVRQEELWPGGPTPLWTALDDAMRSIADEPGRRVVYAIGMPDLSGNMKDLAAETGGGHFNLTSDANLSESFVRVVEELHHQFLFGFSPAVLDGRCRSRCRRS